MVEFTVRFNRTAQLRQYFPQTIELGLKANSIEELESQCTPDNLKRVARIYTQLEEVGDELLVRAFCKQDVETRAEERIREGGASIHNNATVDPSRFSPVPETRKKKG